MHHDPYNARKACPLAVLYLYCVLSKYSNKQTYSREKTGGGRSNKCGCRYNTVKRPRQTRSPLPPSFLFHSSIGAAETAAAAAVTSSFMVTSSSSSSSDRNRDGERASRKANSGTGGHPLATSKQQGSLEGQRDAIQTKIVHKDKEES